MKRMKMGIAVLITAALLLVCMTPLAVFADNTRYPTPGGYNDNDYQKLVTFLELEDESGVRNGEKISENYDPQDPTTWEGTTWENGNIFQIDFYDRNLIGKLDVSNCTELVELDCSYNQLTELDISNNTAMWILSCRNNQLTSLNLESSYSLSFLADRVEAEGNGFIAVNLYSEVEDYTYFGYVYAEPKSGSTFIGWYDENGVLLSSEAEFDISDANSTVFIAKFEGGSPELTEYTVTINHNENGATDPTAGSYTVADGEEIAITITPDEKYMVQSVLVNGVETVTEIVENVLTLTITGDTTVEVVFTKIPKTGAIALTSMAIMSMISGAAIIIYKKK